MNRRGIGAIVGVVVVCLAVAGGYFLHVLDRADAQSSAAPAVVASVDPVAVLAAPHLVFRNLTPGPDYGRIAAVPLDAPGGGRALFAAVCERSYAVRGAGVCVTAQRGVVPTYGVTMLDASLAPTTSSLLDGLPSRARMSSDGSLVATTTFVTGHSYSQASFSTSTVLRRDGVILGDLESFTTVVDAAELTAVDRNYWGVTFAADDDTFYATAGVGRSTWLVKGSLSQKTMTSLHGDAECPSVSPDGTKVAYKKRAGARTGEWRIAVLDLATGTETLLAETRDVDDQQEWLDDAHLLYALPRTGADATTSDIWVVPADGSGQPTVLVEHGASPAVVRFT